MPPKRNVFSLLHLVRRFWNAWLWTTIAMCSNANGLQVQGSWHFSSFISSNFHDIILSPPCRHVRSVNILYSSGLHEKREDWRSVPILPISINMKNALLSSKAFLWCAISGRVKKTLLRSVFSDFPARRTRARSATCEPAPQGMAQQKIPVFRPGLFWCAIGDSNPGPTD